MCVLPIHAAVVVTYEWSRDSVNHNRIHRTTLQILDSQLHFLCCLVANFAEGILSAMAAVATVAPNSAAIGAFDLGS